MNTIGVSIAIPEPWAADLQAYRTSIGDTTAALIPTHITLVPPMLVPRARWSELEEHLCCAGEAITQFDIHLRGTGTFRPVSPVVFVSLVEGISQTELLAESCRRGPLGTDLAFPFHPHVTIAHDVPEESLDRAFDELADFECRFRVRDFHLYVHDEVTGWRVATTFELAPEAGPASGA